MTQPPIFIVGSPRSGTTLLRQILDRHPALAICGETQFHPLVYLQRKAFGDLGHPENRERLIREYLASYAMRKAGLDSAELAQKLTREATSYQALFTSILSYYAEAQGKPRCGEKTPRHALFLDTLCEWFPNAVILHMVRDPRAAVASLQRESWASDSVVVNARRWLKANRAAHRFRERPGYLEVRYEALVTDPIRELHAICAFLGEEYSPLMLVPDQKPAAESAGVKRWKTAVTPARLDVWKQELTAAQVAQVEWTVGSALETFGYQRSASPASALTVIGGVSYAAWDFTGHVVARLPVAWRRFRGQGSIEQSLYQWSAKGSRKGTKDPSREGA